MALNANENAAKILAMLNSIRDADLIDRGDFLEAVRNLCEQVKDFPFPDGSQVIPRRFPG